MIITEGYLLDVKYYNEEKVIETCSLAFSSDPKELGEKALELNSKIEEKKNRYWDTMDIRIEYMGRLSFYLKGFPKDSNTYNCKMIQFHKENPIPSEISEFISFYEDPDYPSFAETSRLDLDVTYYVTNLVGIKNEGL